MREVTPIYERPSHLSLGLIAGLAVAVVLTAGWLAMTIMLSRATAMSGGAAPADTGTGSPVGARSRPAGAMSLQFDWPDSFSPPPALPRMELMLAPPAPPAESRGLGGSGWPADPDADATFDFRPVPTGTDLSALRRR